ncbi:MAG: DUF1326 domain-containing protein [Actinomycetota bacterium]
MADTATATKWQYTADYLELCNCAYGCPCNFNGFPTHGNCRSVIGMKIRDGRSGDVDLSGATFVMAFDWPGAIHEGNGKAALWFDTSTTEDQMRELGAILLGQYGGMPHEILSTTISEVLGPFVEPVEMTVDDTRSSVKVGDKVSAAMTPHVSPMDESQEQEVHIVIPEGFIWKDAKAARAINNKISVDGLSFEDKDTNAFYGVVEHSN